MIDDKKIEAAKEEIYEDRFLLNGEEIVFDNDDKEEMFYEGDIKEAIGLGAKWAINEFIKNLWHPASEIPDEGKHLIVEYSITDTIKDYVSLKRLDNSYIFWDWVSYFESANVTRWLYIDDLLPKEGGNK